MDVAFGFVFLLIVALIGLALFALWVYALIDAIRTPEASFQTGTQLIWVIVILFGNVIGAIIYLVMGRPRQV